MVLLTLAYAFDSQFFNPLKAAGNFTYHKGQWRAGGVWGVQTPRNSESPSKSCQTQVKTVEFRTPTPQDVRKKCTKILKLPSVRSSFTIAMTNKLVFIINSLKVPEIKKILPYEMYQITAASRTPD